MARLNSQFNVPHPQVVFDETFCSQTWQGIPWQHRLIVVEPPQITSSGIILEITGDDAGEVDIAIAFALASHSQMRVAVLYLIPNQPLFGIEEDDLIAHTFVQFLETGDTSWPLLHPMVTAVLRAMDHLEPMGSGFFLTGASKRGWTAWLAGLAHDTRVFGIAPRVFDNLVFHQQLDKQIADWGTFSDEISDYTRRQLQDLVDAPRGKELLELVDPFFHLANLSCPVLIVNGANDPYWTVDALSIYWEKLPQPKACLVLPNQGHRLNLADWSNSVGQFAASVDQGLPLPHMDWSTDEKIVATNDVSDFEFWSASSDSLRFEQATWATGAPSGPNVAAVALGKVAGPDGDYLISTPVKVLRG